MKPEYRIVTSNGRYAVQKRDFEGAHWHFLALAPRTRRAFRWVASPNNDSIRTFYFKWMAKWYMSCAIYEDKQWAQNQTWTPVP